MNSAYRICVRCLMDTTDPDITFDKEGVCSHCRRYEALVRDPAYLKKREPGALEALVAGIKREGRRKKYDCIIGVSGGVDSMYTAYLTKSLGLRPLAVHLDNGWNSELAVSNIEKILKILGIELYTHVLDWDEFKDLQLSFLKASVPDSEIPTDHAILALFYRVAAKENVRYILSGHNTATEGGGVAAWSQGHWDWRFIKSIQKRFGRKALRDFPHVGPFRFGFYTLMKRMQWIPILDYVEYRKDSALALLQNTYGWRDYGGKHYESVYTRFYQGYILPRKFGFDKRKLHVSSLIWSGQMTREQALEEYKKDHYPEKLQEQDRIYVIKKLKISAAEFDEIMNRPVKSFWDYPSYKRIFHRHRRIMSAYHALQRK
jgi:N-acetyl sugar amidotransferase